VADGDANGGDQGCLALDHERPRSQGIGADGRRRGNRAYHSRHAGLR
jgi:hypothetical protein